MNTEAFHLAGIIDGIGNTLDQVFTVDEARDRVEITTTWMEVVTASYVEVGEQTVCETSLEVARHVWRVGLRNGGRRGCAAFEAEATLCANGLCAHVNCAAAQGGDA